MHLLVAINNNITEWRGTLNKSQIEPRLPLPYAFGAAFLKRGHKLSALNISDNTPTGEAYPFTNVYSSQDFKTAINCVDVAALWGGLASTCILRQSATSPFRRKIILCSYVWQIASLPTLKSKRLGIVNRFGGQFAKAVVVMTDEQADLARRTLAPWVPVIKFRCGIDTEYYRTPASFSDVPLEYQRLVAQLLSKPYIIMPGDELRCNDDALTLVERSDLRLVRISQHGKSNKKGQLEGEVARRGIQDRFFIFEGVSYNFMRFLLQNARVYAGLVDSSWQPAGWTVVCEALATGLPVVVYEGLVTRELFRIGVDPSRCRSIPMGDINAFQSAIEYFVNESQSIDYRTETQNFARLSIDINQTGDDFVKAIEQLMD